MSTERKQQKVKLFVPFLIQVVRLKCNFSGDCFQIHFMGCSCDTDRKVGGKEKLHLSAE